MAGSVNGLDAITEAVAEITGTPESVWRAPDGKFQGRVRRALEVMVKKGRVKKEKRFGANNGHSYSNVYSYIPLEHCDYCGNDGAACICDWKK
jgi:hypothetical protein